MTERIPSSSHPQDDNNSRMLARFVCVRVLSLVFIRLCERHCEEEEGLYDASGRNESSESHQQMDERLDKKREDDVRAPLPLPTSSLVQ